ncbi:MAG TPA: response regulator [Gemmataceae bacterium]|nr:response regulator [Gemmataceae bacterium]
MWPSSGRAPSSASRAALQTLGYTILEARDGDEALQCFMSHAGPIHLLITDVVMPRMSGRRLADLLLASRPGLKVLFISGYTDDAVVRHGLLDAGVAFLQKPFTPSVLAQKVLHVLDQRQAFGVRRKPLPPTPSPQRRGGASQITSFLLPLSVAGRGLGGGVSATGKEVR